MGIIAILELVATYGPTIFKVIQAIGPVIQAAKPIINALVSKGMSEDEATTKVFNMMSRRKWTEEEEKLWMDHAEYRGN